MLALELINIENAHTYIEKGQKNLEQFVYRGCQS